MQVHLQALGQVGEKLERIPTRKRLRGCTHDRWGASDAGNHFRKNHKIRSIMLHCALDEFSYRLKIGALIIRNIFLDNGNSHLLIPLVFINCASDIRGVSY
ncbi:hypothetical protein D9M73_292950 [compost metagenome]